LTVFAAADDVALLRAMLGGDPRIEVANESPYRLGEQSTLLLRVMRARAGLVHFPHYNLPLAFTGRSVVTIHDLFSYRFPEIHSRWLPRRVNRLLISNAVRRAAAIITPSHATADDVASRFPSARERIVSIAEATDDRFAASRNPPGETAWQRYFGIRPPYFLYLGQWKAYKNVPLVIEAFGRIVAQRPGVQLVIAGQDPRHPEVAAAVSRLPQGSALLPGHLPDDAVADLYRGAAAVVMPSRAEGFGLPVLEAMACGVTVVCSDIPVLRELAEGVAIFCDPGSTASFAAGMVAALDARPEDGRIPRGIERARLYSWRKAAEETVRIYERVLAGRPSTRSETD
jgi:glycosyltransferase involved in cell wall biosynthesis